MTILLVTLGSRGDVQPFCLLGRELARRGHDVRLVTTPDFRGLAAEYDVPFEPISDSSLKSIFQEADAASLFDQHASRMASLGFLWNLARVGRRAVVEMALRTRRLIDGADLVVFTGWTTFAGEFAREGGVPSCRVSLQPLLPSRRMPASLLASRDLGPLGNRLTYTALRLPTLLLAGAFAQVRSRTGGGRRLTAGANWLTLGLRDAPQLLAFSAALAPDPGDWPVPTVRTGFWFDDPPAGAALPPDLAAFLAAGPPPIYVGFGSMQLRAERVAALVLAALRLWGGRAVLSKNGGLRLPEHLPPNLFATGAVPHDLLLPRVSAVVHHGGAGTTAAVVRHGLPSVLLPVVGDQLFWGRKVSEAGACDPPVALGRVTPEELARRIARACELPGLREAARKLSAAVAAEPGLRAAADFLETLPERRRDPAAC